MLSADTKSLIHLNLIPGIGNYTIRRLLAAFGSAEKSIAATSEELAQIDGLTPDVRQQLIDGRSRAPLAQELQLIEQHQCHIVTISDESYPPLLKQIHDPPVLLYIIGKFPLQDTPSVAIVGSRSPTEYGKTTSQQLSYQLAERGITVVSGFARGIDTCVHRGALEAGGRTVAVFGCGLSIIYPETNRALAAEIIESGALISEFPMTMPPRGKNFPRRNRVISGLTLGTLVVEASERSGSLITAHHAAEQGREVFAVPGQIFSGRSRGTHSLINQGATLINSVDDLLDALPQDYTKVLGGESSKLTVQSPPSKRPDRVASPQSGAKRSAPAPQPKTNLNLTPDEQVVLSAMDTDSVHIDEITRVTQLPIGKVSSLLVMLELKGIVQQLPGKQFVKK
ncbi:DNA-protecting protein DprA [Candidatus Poribacteria bacterium]|nr:MAG: DNA-protecting protein DprA [Candidatus Poribacteria bacterium]